MNHGRLDALRHPDGPEPLGQVGGQTPPRHYLELYALVIVCARSGFPKLAITPETRERLARMDDPLARFLKTVVAGGMPRIPRDLPGDVQCMLEDLLRPFEESRSEEHESSL